MSFIGKVIGGLTCFIILGCSQKSVHVVEEKIVDRGDESKIMMESIAELRLETINLQTLESYDVMYTPYESDRFVFMQTENVSVEIDEYYNENTKLYSYVLTAEEAGVEEDSENRIYKIIKIHVGTLKDEDKGIYTLSTTSPLYISDWYTEKLDMDFTNQNYFLFSSQKRLFNEEFRVELIMVGEDDCGKGDDYPETFRLINVSGGLTDGYTIFTD